MAFIIMLPRPVLHMPGKDIHLLAAAVPLSTSLSLFSLLIPLHSEKNGTLKLNIMFNKSDI